MSGFKMSTVSHNERTQTIKKLLFAGHSIKKQIEKKLEMMGITKQMEMKKKKDDDMSNLSEINRYILSLYLR